MAYTNVWSTTLPNGSEAASSIAALIDAVRIDVGDRLADIFGIPDMTVDPLRPYNIKFTDIQNSVINVGDNLGTPRTLNINNKANSLTFFAVNGSLASFNVPVTVTTGTSAFQAVTTTSLVSTALIVANAGLAIVGPVVLSTTNISQLSYETPIIRFYIGDGTGYSFRFSKRSASVTTDLVTITDLGLATFTNTISLTGGATQLVLGGTAPGQIWFKNDNNTQSYIVGNDGSLHGTAYIIYDNTAGATRISLANTGAVTFTGNIVVQAGIQSNNSLAVISGTSSLQAVTATTIAATNTITSTVTAAALVANGTTTAARWVEVSNTSGQAIFGVESSVGGTLITGATGYDTVVRGNSGISFTANGGTLHGRMSSAGGLTLNAGLTISAGTTAAQAITATQITATSNIYAGSLAQIGWSASSVIEAVTNGNVAFYNNAKTGFNALQFGGTSASFPALRRNLATLDVILADGSAYASLNVNSLSTQVGGIFSVNTITVNAGGISIISGGISVSSGTSAFQAVTATTVTPSANVILGSVNYRQGTNTSVSTTATAIYTYSGAGIDVIIVTGTDGTNKFTDIVTIDGSAVSTAVVLGSLFAPAARTYTVVSSNLKLQMGAGTYTIKTAPLQFN